MCDVMSVHRVYYNNTTGFIRIMDNKRPVNGSLYETDSLFTTRVKNKNLSLVYQRSNFKYKASLHKKFVKKMNLENTIFLLLESKNEDDLKFAKEILIAKHNACENF